ncbi:NAD(P)H-binding protein [Nocardiopsis sp. CNT-189]
MILVTGATGNVGGQAVRQLHAAGESVRALVRTPGKAAFPEGVEEVVGDLSDPASLEGAFNGADAVFLVWPLFGAETAPAVIEAAAHHTEQVVYLSSAGVDDAALEQGDAINDFHGQIELLLARSGLRWTAVRGGGFASNDLGWAERVRQGATSIATPFPGAVRSVVHEGDLAAAAVHVLTAPDGGKRHDGKKYTVTGPEILSEAERIAIVGETVGRPIGAEPMPLDEARAELIASGLPAEYADGILEAHAEFAAPGHTEELHTVQELTGEAPRTYRQWVADHLADFRP